MLGHALRKLLTDAIAVSFLACMLAGCGGGGSTPPVSTSAALTVENYVVTCILFDEDIVVDQDAYLVPGDVIVRATDKNGATVKVYADKTGGNRIDGAPQSTSSGIMTFYLDSAAVALPITLSVTGIATNFIPNNKIVTINSAGFYTVSVGMIDEITTPVDSVQTTSVTTTADLNGTTPATPVIATVVPIDSTKSAATATIPASTVITTASGLPLTGAVKVSLASVAAGATTNNEEVSQLASFPGGLGTVILPAPPTGTTSTIGAMETTGFVRVHLTDASGNVAHTLTNPITVRLDILAGTINPATGSPIAAGDSMPIWTYDETTQQWSPFNDSSGNQLIATVLSDSTGLYVQFTTTHLSYFAMALFTDKCQVAVSDKSLSLFDIRFRSPNYLDACVPTSSTRCVANIPKGRSNIQMVVKVKKLGITLYTSPKYPSTDALCSSGTVLPTIIQLLTNTVSLKVRNVCPTDNRFTSPIFSQEVRLLANTGTDAAPIPGNYQFSVVTNNTDGGTQFESTNDKYIAWVQKRGTSDVLQVPITVSSANVTKNIDFPDTSLCPVTGGF